MIENQDQRIPGAGKRYVCHKQSTNNTVEHEITQKRL